MPQFSTFGGIESTGLNPVLEGTGPFTLFAPTNDALETLNIDLASLTQTKWPISFNTIVAGEMTGNAAENTSWSNTSSRNEFICNSSKVVIDGLATLTDVDIVADNGLIHVLDGEFLPTELRDRIDLICSSALTQDSVSLGTRRRCWPAGIGPGRYQFKSAVANHFNAADIDPEDLTQPLSGRLQKIMELEKF